jgi:hypothetical protein
MSQDPPDTTSPPTPPDGAQQDATGAPQDAVGDEIAFEDGDEIGFGFGDDDGITFDPPPASAREGWLFTETGVLPRLTFAEAGEPFRTPPRNEAGWGFYVGFLQSVLGALNHVRGRLAAFERQLASRKSRRFLAGLKADALEAERDLLILLAEAEAGAANARCHRFEVIDGGRNG